MRVNPPSLVFPKLKPSDEVTFVPMEAIGENGGLDLRRSVVINEMGSGYTTFDEGDVVVAKITPCFENGKGALAVGLPSGTSLGTTELHVLQANSCLNNKFLFYVTISTAFRQYGAAEMIGAGGQKRVPTDYCKNFGIPIPPLPEQITIAKYLDNKTSRIDSLIERKSELVALLKEKRSALISQTVTKGLPPDAARAAGLHPHPKMKDSGIEWLGEVPEHWEVRRLRHCALRIQSGSTPPTSEERYYENGTVPWYGPSSFNEGVTLSSPVKLINDDAVKEGTARLFDAHATMIVTIGTVGKVSSLPAPGSCNQQITVVESNPQYVVPRFLTYCLKSLEPAMRAVAPGTTLPILSLGVIADIVLPVPTLQEQEAIIDYLDEKVAVLEELMSRIETAIIRLHEYRTALISSAVTGGIDVSNSGLGVGA